MPSKLSTPPLREAAYQATGERYGELLTARLRTTVTITKKWQDTDLVWPHSDIDLRVILNEPPDDWLSFNEQLAQVHRELAASAPVMRRVLEHPPGWVFLRRETDAGLVPAAEAATWSHCHGSTRAVDGWRTSALARPWTAEDERFYRGVIAARISGAYRLELDSAENVVLEAGRYTAHCVAWHYLAPVIFAAASLREHRRYLGKTQALAESADAAAAAFLHLARRSYDGAPSPAELMAMASELVAGHVPPPEVPVPELSSGPTLAEAVSAIGVMRCRVARYLYYLDPPRHVSTGYLINRETKDLHAAARTLRAAAGALSEPLRGATVRFLELVPPPPTTRRSLREFLDNAASEPEVVQRLFSADFTLTTGGTP